MQDAGYRLGALMVAMYRQDGQLLIRQEEQVRRTLLEVAEALDWAELEGEVAEPVEETLQDVRRLVRSGLKSLEAELDATMAEKRREIQELKKAATQLNRLSEQSTEDLPDGFTYRYSAASSQGDYVTKTEELTFESPQDAADAAANIEKRLDRWTTLRDDMMDDLKRQRAVVGEARDEIQVFMSLAHVLCREVLEVLH